MPNLKFTDIFPEYKNLHHWDCYQTPEYTVYRYLLDDKIDLIERLAKIKKMWYNGGPGTSALGRIFNYTTGRTFCQGKVVRQTAQTFSRNFVYFAYCILGCFSVY